MTSASYSLAPTSREEKSTCWVCPFLPVMTSVDEETIVRSAPASSSSCHGLVSSTSSKPFVAMKATFLPSSTAIIVSFSLRAHAYMSCYSARGQGAEAGVDRSRCARVTGRGGAAAHPARTRRPREKRACSSSRTEDRRRTYGPSPPRPRGGDLLFATPRAG